MPEMLPQYYTKCSDKALFGIKVSCKILKHRHVVETWRVETVVGEHLEEELHKKIEMLF